VPVDLTGALVRANICHTVLVPLERPMKMNMVGGSGGCVAVGLGPGCL
jgi:hypothetical protein